MDDFLNGFGERIRNLVIYKPLFELEKSRKYADYDEFSLGFAILLFILDNMLIGREPCDHESVAAFLRREVEQNYHRRLTPEESLEMAYYFLDALRNGGRPFNYTYHDLEQGTERNCKFALIETASYEIYGKMRFKLTTTGLDLLFKTREVYQELRITISQLYLRQQIEKGVFQEALHTVDDLYVQVADLHQQLERLKLQIMHNVSGVEVSSYVRLVNRIHQQLEREREVFLSLQRLLRQTEESYSFRNLNERERKSLDQLLLVSRRLDLVVNEHNRLFSHKLSLAALFEEAMVEGLANTFSSRINFEEEIVDRVLEARTGSDELRQLLQPLLLAHATPRFNLMRIFQPQLIGKEEDEEQEPLSQPDPESEWRQAEREEAWRRQREQRYHQYLKLVLLPLLKQESYRLSEILRQLPPADYARIISEVDFYIFLVQFHQIGSLPLAVDQELEQQLLNTESGRLPFLLLQVLQEYPELQGRGELQVVADGTEVTLANGTQTADYLFRLVGEEQDAGTIPG